MKVVCKVAFDLSYDEFDILQRANDLIYSMFITVPGDTREESLLREAQNAIEAVIDMVEKQSSNESEDV